MATNIIQQFTKSIEQPSQYQSNQQYERNAKAIVMYDYDVEDEFVTDTIAKLS